MEGALTVHAVWMLVPAHCALLSTPTPMPHRILP